ncbi:hypothetical protein [Caldibacillus debilis]|uniref:Uncharacterized protein n=1 Tax=Caldibacillus debilis GB1 TaxID=1339248 RepID=A0A420VDR8_9BACI|nr:hypothetical protein [Caldibacillus debilis]RKO61660.1 hypothetical protein Cdeb_01131 [Caldibacillus debilis GB1]
MNESSSLLIVQGLVCLLILGFCLFIIDTTKNSFIEMAEKNKSEMYTGPYVEQDENSTEMKKNQSESDNVDKPTSSHNRKMMIIPMPNRNGVHTTIIP